MNPYQFRISLKLRHPTKDLSFASAQLGLAPRQQWTYGAPRTAVTGVSLEGEYRESYWVAALLGDSLHDSRQQSLDEALAAVLENLRPHHAFLNQFQDDGGSLYLFVGIFGRRNFRLAILTESFE